MEDVFLKRSLFLPYGVLRTGIFRRNRMALRQQGLQACFAGCF